MFSDHNGLKLETNVKEKAKKYFMQMETKKAVVAIFISDKIYFKTKAITRDKGHCIILKGSIQ